MQSSNVELNPFKMLSSRISTQSYSSLKSKVEHLKQSIYIVGQCEIFISVLNLI